MAYDNNSIKNLSTIEQMIDTIQKNTDSVRDDFESLSDYVAPVLDETREMISKIIEKRPNSRYDPSNAGWNQIDNLINEIEVGLSRLLHGMDEIAERLHQEQLAQSSEENQNDLR